MSKATIPQPSETTDDLPHSASEFSSAPPHLLPANTKLEPVTISIVIPALNEALTIAEFVAWCRQGIAELGVSGQILIVDSSTDETPQIALAGGAEVLRVPKRGLGQAYIDALPYIRGQYVLLGDADLTYDFRELRPFHEKFQQGFEFVMGSRFAGYIEPQAMPPLHQYFGTPVTTAILNSIYGTKFSDIHCGMRGLSIEAFRKIRLETSGWEYASEMIVKAVRLKLKIGEVPIRFYKDREGRLSHHRRSGWLSPWKAGWTNLRAMFTYAPDLFFVRPGLALFLLGFGGSTMLAPGPIPTPWFTFNLNSLLFSIALAILGFSLVTGGLVVKLYYNFDRAFSERFFRRWTYDRLMCVVALLFALGLLFAGILVVRWVAEGYQLATFDLISVYGLELIMLGAQTFSFTLMIEALKRIRYHPL
jgi:glycosyltransferase involved in cell wall biosynthesis